MSAKLDLMAFVRLDSSGRVVPGSLIFRNRKPREGRWLMIQTETCCGVSPAYLQTIFFENNATADVTITKSNGATLLIAAGTNVIAEVKDIFAVSVEAAGSADYDILSTAGANIGTGTIVDTGNIDITALTTAVQIVFTDAA